MEMATEPTGPSHSQFGSLLTRVEMDGLPQVLYSHRPDPLPSPRMLPVYPRAYRKDSPALENTPPPLASL